MICRTWTARSTISRVGAYEAIAKEKVLAELQRVPGFRGGILLKRTQEGPSHDSNVSLLFLTFWESMDAIRAFAGDDPRRAVVLPEAEAALTAADETADHWEIVLSAGVAPGP